jgi:hypothetical protein
MKHRGEGNFIQTKNKGNNNRSRERVQYDTRSVNQLNQNHFNNRLALHIYYWSGSGLVDLHSDYRIVLALHIYYWSGSGLVDLHSDYRIVLALHIYYFEKLRMKHRGEGTFIQTKNIGNNNRSRERVQYDNRSVNQLNQNHFNKGNNKITELRTILQFY